MIEDEQGNMRCWRCGMLLPGYELKMWEGQLYCAYCFQDVMMTREDDEKTRAAHARTQEEAGQANYGGEGGSAGGSEGGRRGGGESGMRSCEVCGRSTSHGHYAFSGKFVCSDCHAKESKTSHGGYCMRCGRESNELYMLGGEQLCMECFSSETASGGKGWASALKTGVEKLFGIGHRAPPRIPQEELDKRFKKEVERRKKETPQESGKAKGEKESPPAAEKKNSLRGDAGNAWQHEKEKFEKRKKNGDGKK
ncbi:Uncharacterised protein [Candidatus Burarchaeum australiense]|nr:Uncharacterised protein [Candidatus Burarchaeum australiense]